MVTYTKKYYYWNLLKTLLQFGGLYSRNVVTLMRGGWLISAAPVISSYYGCLYTWYSYLQVIPMRDKTARSDPEIIPNKAANPQFITLYGGAVVSAAD